jgi:hypothetical protein
MLPGGRFSTPEKEPLQFTLLKVIYVERGHDGLAVDHVTGVGSSFRRNWSGFRLCLSYRRA